MDLSIIIVNWNSKDYLKNCIASILAATHGLKFEIVVIDSGSFDGCKEMLLHLYPEVRFIQSENNVGFAKANNKAFYKAYAQKLLFLNPDTIVKDDAIHKLSQSLECLPDAGIVGPKLLNSDQTVQLTCIRVFPNILTQILDAEILMRFFPRSRLWGTAHLFNQPERPSEVDAISGACLMIKRSVFEEVGLFSDDYFMYSEDIDLCYKVKEAGWKTYYIPSATVVHHGGASSSQTKVNTFSAVMMLESRWRFFRKTRSLWYCQQYCLVIFFSSLFRITLLLFAWPAFRIRGKAALINKALKKWTSRLRWTLGLENWVKNY